MVNPGQRPQIRGHTLTTAGAHPTITETPSQPIGSSWLQGSGWVGEIVVGANVGLVVGANVGSLVGASVHVLQCAGHAPDTMTPQPVASTRVRHSAGSGPYGHTGVGKAVGMAVGARVGDCVCAVGAAELGADVLGADVQASQPAGQTKATVAVQLSSATSVVQAPGSATPLQRRGAVGAADVGGAVLGATEVGGSVGDSVVTAGLDGARDGVGAAVASARSSSNPDPDPESEPLPLSPEPSLSG